MLSRLRVKLPLLLAALVAMLCAFGSIRGGAQVLARPGLSGSGITAEPWWRSAVFYRITPEHFQDSDGDGVGDLRGVAERLDYLRALGVDAVVLQLPFDDGGFDDLLAEASRRHIRLVIGLRRDAGTPGASLQAQARQWLSRGAAGILLPPASSPFPSAAEDDLRRGLRRAAADYPGERVVIASPMRAPSGAAAPLQLGTRALRLDTPQLILSTLVLPVEALTASAIAAAVTQSPPAEGAPLLAFSPAATGVTADAKIEAAILLTQRSAILLEYGEELGTAAPRRMPWTPTNVTPAPVTPVPEASPDAAKAANPPAPDAIVYGPYRPYVPPPPKPKLSQMSLPAPGEPALPNPNTLPGFSTKALAESDGAAPIAGSASVPSVALQERDPYSLLNLYRKLLALHHGNATLRSGSLALLHGSEGAAVWLRLAPAGARTAASVVMAANCGSRPVTLSLDGDLAQLRLRPADLRSLLPEITGYQTMSSDHLMLPAHGIYLGELSRGR